MPMTFFQPNLISIGFQADPGSAVRLTDESRTPLKQSLDQRMIDKTLASGRKKRFIQRNATNISVSWDYMPYDSSHTIDGYGGFSDLVGFVYSGEPLVVTLHYRAEAGETNVEFNYFVTEFSTDIALRRGPLENWRFNVSLGLEQIA